MFYGLGEYPTPCLEAAQSSAVGCYKLKHYLTLKRRPLPAKITPI